MLLEKNVVALIWKDNSVMNNKKEMGNFNSNPGTCQLQISLHWIVEKYPGMKRLVYTEN